MVNEVPKGKTIIKDCNGADSGIKLFQKHKMLDYQPQEVKGWGQQSYSALVAAQIVEFRLPGLPIQTRFQNLTNENTVVGNKTELSLSIVF